MTMETIPTYYSAPNYSTPPPEAGGPLRLGTLLADLKNPIPLNPTDQVPIQDEICQSHFKRFRTTTRSQSSGGLGFFAKVFGQEGIGGKLGINGARSAEEVLDIKHVDTESFTPSLEYIRLAIEKPSVMTFRTACRDKVTLYLISGIKIARGASVSVVREGAFGGGLEAGMPDLATGVVELGATARGERSKGCEMSFEEASDFVLGYRVSQVKVKRDKMKVQSHIEGATLLADEVKEFVGLSSGEIEIVHDFAVELAEADSVLLDAGEADVGPCRWVVLQV